MPKIQSTDFDLMYITDAENLVALLNNCSGICSYINIKNALVSSGQTSISMVYYKCPAKRVWGNSLPELILRPTV